MFPFCFEWQWDPGHLIFMGSLYMVLTVVGLGLAYAAIRTFLDLKKGNHGGESTGTDI